MSQVSVMAKIVNLRLSNTPAHTIVTRPGHELWLPGAPAVVVERLCRNVYWFGRTQDPVWTWGPVANGNGTGEPMARGQVTTTNCGGFNLTARWIGHNVLGLDPLQFAGAYTAGDDTFITVPGLAPIDRNWVGNVRTLTHDFAQFNAYFFVAHSYCQFGGNFYDASTNTMNFHNKVDLFWCTLHRVFNTELGGRAFRVVAQQGGGPVIPGGAPYAVISSICLRAFRHLFPVVIVGGGHGVTQSFIRAMPERTGANWETMLLVSRAHLPAEFRAAVNLG